MTTCVVDTNVLVAANGWGTHADEKCHEQCVEELERIKKHCVVVVTTVPHFQPQSSI